MPEEHWQAHGGIAACDLCHSRKVKCDRKEPCSNCVVSKAECLRTRHKRLSRPKVRTDDKIQALVQRLSSLEESIHLNQRAAAATPLSPPAPLSDTSIGPAHHHAQSDSSPSSSRPAKRKRSAGSHVDNTSSILTPESSATHGQTNDARNYFQEELSHNELLSVNQKLVLETAIDFVEQVSQAPTSSGDRAVWDRNNSTSTDLSESEVLQIILGAHSRERKDSNQLTTNLRAMDHLPAASFERIALAFLEGDADDRTMNLYKIIIHWKACVVYYSHQLNGASSPAVGKVIMQTMLRHLNATCTALDNLSVMVAPSLLLLQALISGAMLMQVIGDPSACWDLIAAASRTVVALGLHNFRDSEKKSELDEEVHLALAWCCHMDRCMSLLLLRPLSLPKLNVSLSSSIKPEASNPISIIEILSMETTPVQEKILELTLDSRSTNQSRISLNDEVALLRNKMAQVYVSMQQARSDYRLEANTDILIQFQSLEFKYFSTLTSVHRLSPTVMSNPLEREECLQSARKALERVKVIYENNNKANHFFDVEINPYLSWTILSYPLCPFFVLFCNVVGTSNARDFQTLQDVTDGMSSLVDQNRYVMRLHRLCVTLLRLCRPLVTQAPQATQSQLAHPGPATSPSQDSFDSRILDANMPAAATGPTFVQPDVGSSWNDNMMWQLFQSQPSLDWFNSDILDPTFGVV